MSGAGIELRDVEIGFGRGEFTLRVASLDIEPGERVAIVGPSGCGKTTLLYLLAGILVPAKGTVRVGEEAVHAASDADRRRFRIGEVGLVFQDFELVDYLRVLDNVLLPYRIHGSLRLDADVVARAKSLAASVGLGERLHRGVRQLSQGERQRVAICRALLTEPRIVLADEPTGNLDPATTDRILDVLFERVGEVGATLVTVTHDHGVLDRFDRVIELGASGAGSAA